MKSNNSSKQVSVAEFVDKNERLISVIGIFAAISAYFATLGEKYQMLGFVTFGMFLILCYNLWILFPKSEEASLMMVFLKYFF